MTFEVEYTAYPSTKNSQSSLKHMDQKNYVYAHLQLSFLYCAEYLYAEEHHHIKELS